jgi:hypothetical protein
VERFSSNRVIGFSVAVFQYLTSPLVGSSVFQVIVAPVVVVDEAETSWMLGGVLSIVFSGVGVVSV